MKHEQNDWIEWSGGECPVDPRAQVSYRMRTGDECCIPQRAKVLDWAHDGSWSDIVAYRVSS